MHSAYSARAAVVAIGVGSPVGQAAKPLASSSASRRRLAEEAGIAGAFGAPGDELLGARAAAVAIAVRGVRGHSDDAVLSADRHRGPRPARIWASFLAVGAVDAFCVLGAGRCRRRGLVGGVETRLLARPCRERKGRHRRRRRVTTAASKDDSVVAHSSFASRLE